MYVVLKSAGKGDYKCDKGAASGAQTCLYTSTRNNITLFSWRFIFAYILRSIQTLIAYHFSAS